MLKYDFEKNLAVIDLPSIWKINLQKVAVTTVSGTDSVDIPNNGYLTIQVGNIDPIVGNSGSATSINITPVNVTPVNQEGILDTPNMENLGQLQYTVGLISDIHYCITPTNRTIITNATGNENSTDGYNSRFKEDLAYLINNPFKDVDFIASPGDIATYDINDFIQFTADYNNLTDKSFYCALGNHDHLVTYGNKGKWLHWAGESNNNPDGSRWNNVQQSGNVYYCPGSLAKNVQSQNRSNMSYYVEHNGDIFVFLSVSYGDAETLNTSLEQMHPHNQLLENNVYVQLMIAYCKVNTFNGVESNFNFQYYKPEDLIWLKNIVENNKNKRIFIFSHYFLPNKAGGGNKYVPGASTELMGITFHFLNELNNNNTNTVWFSGHSHISWTDESSIGLHWTNKNYSYIEPTQADNSSILTNYTNNYYKVTTGNKPYNRLSNLLASVYNTGWNVHLPSMSRPAGQDGPSECEAAIMKVYENGVEIKKLRYTTSNGVSYISKSDSIDDDTLVIYNGGTGSNNDDAPNIEEETPTVPATNSNQITFRITNTSGQTILFTGGLMLHVGNSSSSTMADSGKYTAYLFFRRPTLYTDNRVKDATANSPKYKYGENTERLENGKSMTITYSQFLDVHSSNGELYPVSSTSNGSIKLSDAIGKYFITTENATFPTYSANLYIKWRVGINRTEASLSEYPNGRIDESAGTILYAEMEKENGANPQILYGKTYNINITRFVNPSSIKPEWNARPYVGTDSNVLDNTGLVQVYYDSNN